MPVRLYTPDERAAVAARHAETHLDPVAALSLLFGELTVYATPGGYVLHGSGLRTLGADPATGGLTLHAVDDQDAVGSAKALILARLRRVLSETEAAFADADDTQEIPAVPTRADTEDEGWFRP